MTDQTAEPVTQQQETVTRQKNPLRIKQGKKLVEYNKCKKEELKCLNEQITKQDDIAEHKPRPNTSSYVYASGLSLPRVDRLCGDTCPYVCPQTGLN